MGRHSMIKATLVCLLIIHAVGQEDSESSSEQIYVKDTSLRIEESDGSVTKEVELTPPGATPDTLKLDHTQTFKVAFTVISQSGDTFRPQQAVVRLTSAQTGAAAYFAATKNKGGSLSASIKSAGVEKQLGSQGGVFEATLLLGDTRIAAPSEWRLGKVTVLHSPLDDGSQPPPPAPSTMDTLVLPKPEITYQHRLPEKAAPALVALAATAACVAPAGLLLVLLARIKANIKGFPTSGPGALWSLLFHGGLASILCLYVLFWLKLNLMQTVPLVAAAGLVTAGFGNRALSSLVQSRQKQD